MFCYSYTYTICDGGAVSEKHQSALHHSHMCLLCQCGDATARNIRDSLHSMDLPRFDCSLLICSFTRWSQGQFDKDFLEKFQYMIISWNTQKKVALCADDVGQSCLFPHASTTSVLNVVLFRNMRLKRRLYPAHVLYIGWMSCCAMRRCITCLFDAI